MTTFFLSKPHVKIGDTVRISGIITEIRYESAFKTKTGARRSEIVVNGDYVVKLVVGDDGQNLKHKKIVVVGMINCQVGNGLDSSLQQNDCRKIIIAKTFQLFSNGIIEKLQIFFDNQREKIKATYFKYLPDEEAQIISGIFLGDAKVISREMYAAFKKAGVLHLFAASGMNLVLFCGFWQEVLNLFVKRRKAVFFAISTSVFYVFLTGFSPSILRAGVMFSFASIGYVLGRPIRPISNLVKSAGFLLFLSPELVTSLGFQLSVLSTLAIITSPSVVPASSYVIPAKAGILSSKIPDRATLVRNDKKEEICKNPLEIRESRFNSNEAMKQWSNVFFGPIFADFRVSTACFLFTAPLILLSFNQINLLSPLANILVLWSVDLIMIFGGALAIFNFVLPKIISNFLISFLIFVFYPIILWFKTVIMYFSRLSFGVINLREGASLGSLLTFSLVVWTIFLLLYRTKSKLK